MMRLTKGKALVLHGPQGTCKTQFALGLAAGLGRVFEVNGFDLKEESVRQALLADRPDVVLVEEVLPDKALPFIKSLITSSGGPYVVITLIDIDELVTGRLYRDLCMNRRFDFQQISHQPVDA